MLFKTLKKTAALFCMLALLAGALWVPVALAAKADNAALGTVTFDFSDACANAAENTEEATANGVGFFGWGPAVKAASDDSTNNVLVAKKTANNAWVTIGGYRLNYKNADGGYDVYNLEPSASYVVSLKVRVLSVSASQSAVYLGFGASYYDALAGNKGNYVNGMSNKVQPVIKSDAGSFRLYYEGENYVTRECGDDWYNVNYIINTPETWSKDTALAVWADMHTGINCEIDDVAVTKVTDTIGAVVFKDDYSATVEIAVGSVGTALTLPDISDRVLQETHSFEGWCNDEMRTEEITELSYEAGVKTVYSKWNAPVKITFKNTLDSTETVVNGMPGDAIKFPANPTDPSGETWFKGWYIDEAYINKFTGTEFGYSDVVLYSLFKGKIPGLKQNFENYSESDWTPRTQENGNVLKSNRNQFGVALEKQSEVTYNDSKYAIKLDWDSTMTKTGENATNPEAYEAATRYNLDNFFYLGGNLENKQSYVVTFKYKVEKAGTPLKFQIASAMYGNIWANTKNYDSPVFTPVVSDEWQDGKIMFTTDFNVHSSIFFKVVLNTNADTVIYFDDFSIDALAQPYESVVVFNGNNGSENIYCVGKIGEKITVPTVTHPDGAVFEGWYTDAQFTEKMSFDTFGEDTVTVYAKWGSLPMNFSSYPFSTTNSNQFGIRTMSIDKSAGVGYNDDYALRFKFRGSDVYSKGDDGKITYMYERATQPQHTARIINGIEEGKLYKITYKYKTEKSNNTFKIVPYTAWGENFWAGIRTTYSEVINVVEDTSSDWKEYTGYFVGGVKTDEQGHKGNSLYLSVVQDSADMSTEIDLLIDNVLVEECALPFVKFKVTDTNYTLLVGEAGGNIEYPEAKVDFGYEFVGWYLDSEFKKPFTQTVFDADTALNVYAKTAEATKVTYTFEKYTALPHSDTVGAYHLIDAERVESSSAYSGNHVIEFDRRGGISSISGAIIEEDWMDCTVEEGMNYVATVKYRIVKSATVSATIGFKTAHHYNLYGNYATVSCAAHTILPTDKTGVWETATFVIDSSKMKSKEYNVLYVSVGGGVGGVIQIDDVTIEKVPKGTALAFVENNRCKEVPQVLYGKKGQSFASKLPTSPKLDNHVFKGYFVKQVDGSMKKLESADMKFSSAPVVVHAVFIKKEIKQSFESDYIGVAQNAPAFSLYDFDFEIYDSLKDGNSKDNVTSGRYSMHRKGESHLVESVSILTMGSNIEPDEKYQLSFKVKMGKHLHTDGAIKLANIKTYNYAWDTSGNPKAVVSIADLADGQWHEVSFVFHSVESFVAFQVPGYVEIFIDDVTFTLMDSNTPVSKEISFTEYIPAKRDMTTGELLAADSSVIDISTIVDTTLEAGAKTGIGVAGIIIIGIGVTLVAAAVIVVLLLRKKKKNG